MGRLGAEKWHRESIFG